MKTWMLIFTLGSLASCGPKVLLGKYGADGVSTGIDINDVAPGFGCHSGGVSLKTFLDKNSNGNFDEDEVMIKLRLVCNGIDGHAGQNGSSTSLNLESVPANSECVNGGIRISSTSSQSSEVVCNGENGLSGQDGQNGIDGKNGSTVLPVKFCSSDKSKFPEFGLIIDGDVFAVYWGSTPSSKKEQAFLTKLQPGTYQSTGGNNCNFTFTEEGEIK